MSLTNISLINIIFYRNIFHITNYLSTNDIPHNFILVKSDAFKSSHKRTCAKVKPSDNYTLRAVIWPKKPAYGNLVGSKLNLG